MAAESILTEVQHEENNEFHNPNDDQDVEGFDESSETLALDLYPIESVLVRQDSRTVYETVRRINSGKYLMDPDFQRDFVWDEIKQSRLIQSAIMRIPLPVFYLAEEEDGRTVVVDGLQRLTTFARFLNDEFALRLPVTKPQPQGGTSYATLELHNKRFRQLDAKLQNRIEDTNLILYLIDAKVPEAVKLDIFERVNSGEPLTKQQMRNCLHVGPATRWLKEQSRSLEFLEATCGSLNPKPMRDREVINRFCGFRLLGLKSYRGDMDMFLVQTLKHMNRMSEEELSELGLAFRTSMQSNAHLFGRHAFRRHTDPSERRGPVNVALFDVLSVLLSQYTFERISENATSLRAAFYQLMGDERLQPAISLGTNQVDRVLTRFELFSTAFEGILGDVDTA